MTVTRLRTAEPTNWKRVPNHVAYRHSRRNVTRLLTDAPASGDRVVAACPEWTIRALVEHLVQISARVSEHLKGREPAESPVPEGAGLAGLLEYWTKTGEQLDRLVDEGAGGLSDPMMMDAFVHELDVRYALGAEVPADHLAYPSALDTVVNGFSRALISHAAPTLRIETRGAHWMAGEGPPVATLSGHRHDIFRSLAGRRTHAQIARLSWSSDHRSWLPAFTWGPFRPPERPIEDAVNGRSAEKDTRVGARAAR